MLRTTLLLKFSSERIYEVLISLYPHVCYVVHQFSRECPTMNLQKYVKVETSGP
jgi:hypothetical protein